MRDSVWFVVMLFAASFYYFAFLSYIWVAKQKVRSEILSKVLPILFWCFGAGINLAVVFRNYLLNGYVPFVSMFQVLTFLAVCFLPMYLFVTYVCGCRGCGAYFSLASAIVMTGPCFMQSGSVWTFPPALQSPWFVPHILMYMLAYSLAAVTFLMTISYLIRKKEDIRRAMYCCVRSLFPFMTAGMFFGAVWADQVWGGFWSWDLKECWALITWLFYMLFLHCARKAKLKKWLPLLSILGFLSVIVTMFFVTSMVSSGTTSSMHTYS